jgi:hypothetical protein
MVVAVLSMAKAPIAIDAEWRKRLDRFGELEVKYQQAKPWIKERETLKEQIRGRFDTAAKPESGYRADGELYHVDLSPKEEKTVFFDKAKAFAALKKALGTKLTDALTYTLKLLDEAGVSADERTKFLRKERIGARDVTAVPKTAPASAGKAA